MNITHCHWHINEKTGIWPSTHHAAPVDLPMMIKRRLTALGRQAIELLYQANDQKKPIPWVIASRHADTLRKTRLLTCLAKKELVSPTDFGMSVHNAIIGTFSIATKNKEMHTAVSGSENTFESGLLEAYALQKDKKSTVGYLYYDTFLPDQLIGTSVQSYPTAYFAMILAEEKGQAGQLTLKYISTSSENTEQKTTTNNDINKLISLIHFLEHHEKNYRISVPGGEMLLERITE